jgi:uncharacterized membrane protein YdcZ (DUF606 family)
MRFIPVLVMIVAGFLVSIQGPINLRLRLAVESPVLERVPFNPVRLVGIGLVFLGVLLVQRK